MSFRLDDEGAESWGRRSDKGVMTRPMTGGNRQDSRRPQSPASARPSTSHVSGRRPQAGDAPPLQQQQQSRGLTVINNTPTSVIPPKLPINVAQGAQIVSKFVQAAQKAVSVVNGVQCLCKHPTLGTKGGECDQCKRKLPVIAGGSSFPLRSRSGSIGFGEAPPLLPPAKANKPSSLILPGSQGYPQEYNRRPATQDGSNGGRRRYLLNVVFTP